MNLSEKIAELSKRRGFYSQTAESYGGVAGFQTFGPEGAELKRKIEDSWRKKFSKGLGNREIEGPTIMPEAVFEASGHLETFDDMIIECPGCGKNSRADHIVEDETDLEEAEGLSIERIEEIFEENDLRCPNCGESLAGEKVEDFNLMFETSIGPDDSERGFLRPETAQGIFVEFPRFKEYMRNQLPFGITQIGKAYRNEISPRKGLVRVRELTQAELEQFIDPEEDRPPIEDVEDVELKLLSQKHQREGEEAEMMTVGEALDREIIESEWIAYFLGLAQEWYELIGVDMERFRFRQHQNDELSHYASDCWDAEADTSAPGAQPDWIEITGFAYRGCYDLKKHHEHSEEDYTVFKEYDEPKTVEKIEVNPDMGYLGPEFGDEADKAVKELEKLVEEHPAVFRHGVQVEIDVGGEKHHIPIEKTGFQESEEKKSGEHILPHVVEPSFGIDRIVYTVLAHSYEEDEVDGEERKVLRLSDEVAPTEVAVFPLMDKEGLGEKAREVAEMVRDEGFSVKYDDSGNIGRRYRRQDEVGTPVCVTVDYETLEEEPETVTVRDRDSTEQKRVEISGLAEELS